MGFGKSIHYLSYVKKSLFTEVVECVFAQAQLHPLPLSGSGIKVWADAYGQFNLSVYWQLDYTVNGSIKIPSRALI